MRSPVFVVATVGCALAMVGLPRPALADTYSWRDADGTLHVTDSVSKVPEDRRASAVRLRSSEPSSPEPRSPGPADATGARSAGQAGSRDTPGRPTQGSSGRPGEEIFRFDEGEFDAGGSPAAVRPQPLEAAPGEGAAGGEAEAGPDAPETDRDGHDARWWQGQVVEWANRRLDANERLRNLEANKQELTFGRPTERTQHRKALDQARKDLAEAEHMLQEELPRAAKKAGAKAEWLKVPGVGGELRP